MKIALYIEDGLEQIVLTPESETEKSILDKIHDGSRTVEIKRGAFYGNRGGWTRWKQKDMSPFAYGGNSTEDDVSTMVVLRPAPEPKVE